jgi:two-component system, NarL family, response regulator NreC
MPGGGATSSQLTVALADDHPVVRAGLRTLLSSEPDFDVVAEFQDLATTMRGVREFQPAILLLDLTMQGCSALQAIPDLLAARGGMKIIILTMHEDPGFAREALRLGAHGYLLKDAAADELVIAIRSVLRGQTYLHPTIGARLATLDAPSAELSDRELQVLGLIAAGHTNAEIARHLFMSLRTVEGHRAQIRTKLGLQTRAELSEWANEHGIGPQAAH